MSSGDESKEIPMAQGEGSRPRLRLMDLDRYNDLPIILGIGRIEKKQWEDKHLLTLKYVDISGFTSLNQASKAVILQTALSSLTNQVTESSVGAILAGAWGLISCQHFHTPCFLQFPDMLSQGVKLEELGTGVVKQAVHPVEVKYRGTNSKSWSHWERSAAYMCAAILRLVTKDETNLINAWEYIMNNQYRKFYGEDIAFRISLSKDCVVEVRRLLQTRRVLKETIAVFLLAFQELDEGKDKGMCKMLYETQMCYTGMHAYRLLLFCSSKLGDPIDVFVAKLKVRENKDALETAMELVTTYEFPKDEAAKERANKAKTWRYARIFDSDVFASLQTKNCLLLTGLLACISQKIGSGSSGDATKIREIERYLAIHKDYLDKVAQKIINSCQSAPNKEQATDTPGSSGQSA